MNRLSITVAAALGLTVSAAAQLAEEPTAATPPAVAKAWREFLHTNPAGPAWRAIWSRATGTPVRILGEGIQLTPEPILEEGVAREHSEASLKKYAALLGTGESQYREAIYGKMGRTHVFVYDQWFRGLQVINGRADIRIHDVGRLFVFGSTTAQFPANFSIKPTVAPTVARGTAYASQDTVPIEQGLRSRHVPERLVVWADVNSRAPTLPHLAWEVVVHGESAYGRAYVDAQSGEFLHFESLVHNCGFPGCNFSARALTEDHATEDHDVEPLETVEAEAAPESAGPFVNVTGTVMGWANTGSGPLDALKNVPMPGIRVQVAGGNSGVTDEQGKFNIAHAGTAQVNVTVTFDNSKRVGKVQSQSGGQRLSVTRPVTPGTPALIQIYASNANQNDRDMSTTYWWTHRSNEFVRQPHIIAPASQTPINTADRITVNVGINQACNAYYTRNSINFYKAGSVGSNNCSNTAYSSVVAHEWGHGLDERYGGISQTDGLSEGWADLLAIYMNDDPEVGRGFLNGATLRDARNTKTYPPGGFPSGGAPHPKGEVWMGGAWDCRNNLISTFGKNFGSKLAETIVLGSIIADATNQRTALVAVYVADDDNGNLNDGTPNCNEITAAFVTKRKIPNPLGTCSPRGGTVSFYGAGCPGTGSKPKICANLNGNGGTLVRRTLTSEYAYPIRITSAGSILGAQLFTTSSSTSTATTQVRVYRSAAGQPAATHVATGTMTVSAGTPRFHSVQFDRGTPVQANEIIWIGQIDTRAVYAPNLQSGTTAVTSVYRRLSSGSWVRSSAVTRPALKIECGGGAGNAVPELSTSSGPDINKSFQMFARYGKSASPMVFLIGGSNTRWGSNNLPFSLAPIGGGTCSLLTSPDVTLPQLTDASGTAVLTFSLPNNPWLVGQKFYSQSIILDSGANALGLALTNGAEAKIGS